MRGFVVGLLIGALAGAGAVFFVMRDKGKAAPAVAGRPAADAGVAKKGGKKRGGPGRGAGSAPGVDSPIDDDEPAPVLSAADLRMAAEGDSLSRGAQNLDLGSEDGARDLTRAEIDDAMAGASDAIGACIVDATGAAELSGRITAAVVVGPDGRVTQTRVEAPAWLLRHGLGGCVRPKLRGLRFPATGKESVVKYPFTVG